MCGTAFPLLCFPGRQDGPFVWSELTQGVILSSYFGGYLVSQVPAGRLAERLGAVRVLAVGLAAAGLLTLLTPVCALSGVPALVTIRFLQGAASVSGHRTPPPRRRLSGRQR